MAKGYKESDIRQKLVEILQDSKTGLSGVEISEKLGINRMTMTKYLNVFAAEGLVQQKNVGNINLWFVEEGTEQFSFPSDYFKVKTKYLEALTGASSQVVNLIRNCIHSGAEIPKIITEILIPAIHSVEELYQQGKIGKSEQKFLNSLILQSIQITNVLHAEENLQKNAILISDDTKNTLYSEAAAVSFRFNEWKVFNLGNMSDAIDALFDLDLQKLLGKVWKQKNSIMIVVVFSSSEDSFKFFSEAINVIKTKSGKRLHLVLCGKLKKKTTTKADLVAENLEDVLQWSETTYESFAK
jgi:predicted transcriptional regulator